MTDNERPEDSLQDSQSGEAGGEEAAEPAPEDWPESKELGWAEISAQEMVVCRSTLRRIEWMIGIAGAVCALAAVWPLGWAVAAGMLLGTALGWINFRWLAASVNAIGERIVKVKSRERGAAIVARGVGRIFLIALFAYVIFTYSVRGLMGFLAGLAMPVIAMMCEAAYEFVASIRRSS
jgi:ATP synthase I chain